MRKLGQLWLILKTGLEVLALAKTLFPVFRRPVKVPVRWK